jgi:SAM-dependent methyltransferase
MQPAPCPEHWIEAFDSVAREAFGASPSAASLAQAIGEVSQAYTRERARIGEATRSESALAARLSFFVPRDLPKVQLPLCELARVGALPRAATLRVLDLGAGLGATSLGAGELAGRTGFADRLCVDALDSDSRALELATRLTARSADLGGAAIELSARRADLRDPSRLPIDADYDLIFVGNVVNELFPELVDEAQRVERLRTWLWSVSRRLAPQGALVVLEPALRGPSRILQRLRSLPPGDRGPYVFAPCVHEGPCPLLELERDWCHQALALPMAPTLAARARAAGLRDHDLRFSYLTLVRQPRSLGELAPSGDAARIVSSPRASKGKLELRLCGAGETRWLRRLDRHASAANAAVGALERGALIRLPVPAAAASARVEIGPETRVERLQG